MLRRALVPAALALLLSVAGLPAQDAPADSPPVVEVTAKDFEFEMPEEIRSGWTTFEFHNTGEEEHFFLLWDLPENKTFEDYHSEVGRTFEQVWNRYSSGELTRAEAEEALFSENSELPDWALTKMAPAGGPGLTEPGETSRVTVELEPGTYAMECYVKTPQGTYHAYRGMLREVTVTEEGTGAEPPQADVEVTVSNYDVEVSGELTAGAQTVAVRVAENPDGFPAHDLNLVRLEEETELQEVVGWMDWMDLEEFRAPGPGYWLGGVKNMLAGNTAYTTVDLEPGRYAWVSEGWADEGVVKEFTVEGSTGY